MQTRRRLPVVRASESRLSVPICDKYFPQRKGRVTQRAGAFSMIFSGLTAAYRFVAERLWLRAALSLLFAGSAFVFGSTWALGFEFIPVLDKGQLFFSVGFYGSLLLFFFTISQGLSLLAFTYVNSSIGSVLKFVPRWVLLGLGALVVLASWIAIGAVALKVSGFRVFGLQGLTIAFLAVVMAVTALTTVEPKPESEMQERLDRMSLHFSRFAPAVIAALSFSFGHIFVDYLRINSHLVEVETTGGDLLDLRMGMRAEGGYIMFKSTFTTDCSLALVRVVYLPQDQIRRMTGQGAAVPLIPKYPEKVWLDLFVPSQAAQPTTVSCSG